MSRVFKSWAEASKVKNKSPNQKIIKTPSGYLVEKTEPVKRYEALKNSGIINFRVNPKQDLSEYQERKIREYWQEFGPFIHQSTGLKVVKRTKNRARNEAYAEYTGQNKRFTQANFPLPGYSKDKKRQANYRYNPKTGKVSGKFMGLDLEQVSFDQEELARDGMDYAGPIIRKFIDRPGTNNTYTVMTGDHEVKQGKAKTEVEKYVAELLERYSPGGSKYVEYRPDEIDEETGAVLASNDWRNWGIRGIRYIGQAAQRNERQNTVDEINEANERRLKNQAAKKRRRKKRK